MWTTSRKINRDDVILLRLTLNNNFEHLQRSPKSEQVILNIWHSELAKYNTGELDKALRAILATRKKYPTLSHVLDYLEEVRIENSKKLSRITTGRVADPNRAKFWIKKIGDVIKEKSF